MTTGVNLTKPLGGFHQVGPAKVLCVAKFEEIVNVTDENANQLRHAGSSDNHAEDTEHPGQILGGDFQSKVERHDDIFVQIAPDIDNGNNGHFEDNLHAH